MAELITSITTALTGMFFIGLSIYGWNEVKIIVPSEDVFGMRMTLLAVSVIGIFFYVSGILTLFNLIG